MKLSSEAAFQLAVRTALGLSLTAIGVAHAQEEAPPAGSATQLDTIEVTGTRIVAPGVISASPVYGIEREEINLLQQPEIERIFRLLPITVPGDGQNVNNGTAGAATVNLRGLGAARNLILIDGKRLTPYNVNGLVDTSIIPVGLIERVDLITGGASAVYGSDAMSGAINIITRKNFEGLEFGYTNSITGESDGQIKSSSMLLGGNFGERRGNAVLSLNWTDRQGIQLGQRPLGQLGIVTADGSGYDQFLAGQPPTPPPAGCEGPNAVAAGGSTTTIPTRVSIAGGPGLGQFRTDGSLGANCSVFNFNPYNYYQTPQSRFGATVVGHFDINNMMSSYSRISYSNTSVTQQVAPSGIFGNTFWTPMTNTLIDPTVRNTIIATAEAGRAAGTPTVREEGGPGTGLVNWRDENDNDIVDAPDDLLISYRRRTEELGPRSTAYENGNFQFVVGLKTQVTDTFNLDLSFQRGQSDRTSISAGYTNVANIAQQVESEDGINCVDGAPSNCVPMNLFGGFGTITPAAAAYGSATAFANEKYTQHVTSAVISGLLPGINMPFSGRSIGLSFGVEQRREEGIFNPDECLKLAPTSCLGGAGGNSLPVKGGFKVEEVFGETILPLLDEATLVKSLDLELGYRVSDYSSTGNNNTWKAGLSWAVTNDLLVRVMQQRAVRAPNVGELGAPRVTALDNATTDPCSIANADNLESGDPNDAALRALCASTGMSDPQIGTVQDLVSGQVNIFAGTDQANLPGEEQGDSFTLGAAFTPDLGGILRDSFVTLDYYDIKIENYIDTFSAQEVLDACYVSGQAAQCAKIQRVGGDLVLPGSGIELFTTNLAYRQVEGIELGLGTAVPLAGFGDLKFSLNVNRYLTQEFQSDSTLAVQDCLGVFSTTCRGPRPDIRWIQRTTWDYQKFQVSALWRHIGGAKMSGEQLAAIEAVEGAPVFGPFQAIGEYDYLDLGIGYNVWDGIRLNLTVNNVFDRDPPVVGNEAADTSSNSGNTFPSQYDTVGTVYVLGVNANF